MERNILLLITLFFNVMSLSWAQEKANYKQALKFETEIEGFRNDLSIQPNFINETDVFWYRFRTSDGMRYYIVDPAKKSRKELFHVVDLLGKISEYTRKAYAARNFHVNRLDFLKDGKSFKFYYDGYDYHYEIASKKLQQLPKDKKNDDDILPSGHVISPDSLFYIYAYKHNLYMYGNKDKGQDTTIVQLTTDGEPYMSYAKYPEEAENEEVYPAGKWLKNSKIFMVEMEDDRKLDFMHVIDMVSEPRPKLVSYKYSCPGDTVITGYGIRLVDIKKKKTTIVNIDKWKDQYVELAYDNTKKSDELFFYRTKRTWNEKELCCYNIEEENYHVIFNEVDKPYLDYVIAQTHFLNDAKEFIFRSERTGFGHFYLYDTKTGKVKNQITKGDYLVGQVVKIDTAKRELFYYSYGKEKHIDPYYYVLYRTNFKGDKPQLMTPENGSHKVSISPSSKYIIDSYSRVDLPHVNVVRNRNGKVIMTLDSPDLRQVLESGWKAPERFKVKADDGQTDLYGVMWKPMDFDSTKSYPIISEVYPGPQFEYVPTSFGLESSHASKLAQLGFIVIQVGHRGGTPLRGKAYHRYGYGNLRDYPLADDKAAITQLANRYSYIDVSRVGIFGHSGGGFMSTAALCTYPDFYKAAVASAGNHDNRIYNTGWIEMNNGVEEIVKKSKETPSDSTVTYRPRKIHTNMELNRKYEGHLLLVTGLMDKNVNPAHTVRMAKSLIEAGKNFDMIFLPKSTHGFNGDEEVFFERKMWYHFAKYLLEDYSCLKHTNLKKCE